MDTTIAQKVEAFFKQFRQRIYKKGEILIRADDDPPGIFYLKAGLVKQYAISRRGDELIVNVYKPLAFFPMTWAINDTRNEYYFEAITDLEVWLAPKEAVLAFVKNNSDVLYDLMSRLYRGLDGVLIRMRYLMAGSAYARLITELIIHEKRFGRPTELSFGEKGLTKIELTISERDLAAQSGMTRETVSRELKKLKEKGLVAFDKKILTIYDVAKLEDELH